MAITETRIDLSSFTCPGCDCGDCIGESMNEISRIDGVSHVRVDRRRTQIIVRHNENDVAPEQLFSVVQTKGIAILS